MADGARALVGEIFEGFLGLIIACGVLWLLIRLRVREMFRAD
jgi:hypothetical protein